MFIELTSIHDRKIILNTDKILSIEDDAMVTTINLNDGSMGMSVKESQAMIGSLLQVARIELKDK